LTAASNRLARHSPRRAKLAVLKDKRVVRQVYGRCGAAPVFFMPD